MLKINTYSQGLMALKQMVVSQSSVVKGHTERLGLSFAISVVAAAGAVLGLPSEAAADYTCKHTCPEYDPPNDKCETTCANHQGCEGSCSGGVCSVTCVG